MGVEGEFGREKKVIGQLESLLRSKTKIAY